MCPFIVREFESNKFLATNFFFLFLLQILTINEEHHMRKEGDSSFHPLEFCRTFEFHCNVSVIRCIDSLSAPT